MISASALGEGRVVLDHEHLAAGVAARRRGGGRGRRTIRRPRAGQQAREGAALTDATLETEIAAEQDGELARDGEAEPGAAVAAIGRSLDLLERREDALVVLGRDAETGIGDGERQELVAAHLAARERDATAQRADRERDAPAFGELDGVA